MHGEAFAPLDKVGFIPHWWKGNLDFVIFGETDEMERCRT
jgi:hypothetical protein